MEAETFVLKLREKGYKVTPQRIAIFEAIINSQDHPTADQIYQRVSKKYPTISIATIYHTLHLLTKLGLLLELKFSEMSSRFDSNPSPHINVICPNCGEIYDYEVKSIETFWSQIASELGKKPAALRFDFYTICNKCSKL